MTCTCGVPSRARYYVSAVVGGDETTEVSMYLCADHTPADVGPATVADMIGIGCDDILEVQCTEMRGEYRS